MPLFTMNKYYIYFYYEPDSTNPFYVGKGKGDRAWKHLRNSELKKKDHFHHKLQKMIEAGIQPEIILGDENLTEEEAIEQEIYFIKWFGRLDNQTGCLCNHTDGGEGHSGCIRTEETKLKISETMRSRNIKNGYPLGYKHTFDSRIKMTKKKSAEHSRKIREYQTERNGNPVESFNPLTGETIRQYKSIKEVRRLHGYHQRGIQLVLRGTLRLAYGMGWRYIETQREITEIDPDCFAMQPFEE